MNHWFRYIADLSIVRTYLYRPVFKINIFQMEVEAAGLEVNVEANEEGTIVNQGPVVVTLRQIQGVKVNGKNYASCQDFLYYKDRTG